MSNFLHLRNLTYRIVCSEHNCCNPESGDWPAGSDGEKPLCCLQSHILTTEVKTKDRFFLPVVRQFSLWRSIEISFLKR